MNRRLSFYLNYSSPIQKVVVTHSLIPHSHVINNTFYSLIQMLAESIDDPDQSKQGTQKPQSIFYQYLDFDHFVKELGELNGQNLQFSQCNKFLKLKQSQYMSDSQVVTYFRDVFLKKTSTTIRRKWHMKDKFVLAWTVLKLCHKKGFVNPRMKYQQWEDVQRILKLPKDFLMRKWICINRHTTFHSHWSIQEDKSLKRSMENNNLKCKWSDLAIAVYQQSESNVLRTCKDIREHWKNYLDPRLKKAVWTPEQDSQLLTLAESVGKKWSLLSKMIQGRTQNQVKNRCLALLKKGTKNTIPNTISFSSSKSSVLSSEQQQQSLDVGFSFVQCIKEEKVQLINESLNSVNDSQLQDYITMPLYKKSHDEFFSDI